VAKAKRLTFRYDDNLDKVIREKCEKGDCTKSELIEAVLRDAFEDELNGKSADSLANNLDDDKPIPKGKVVDTRRVAAIGTDGKLEGWRYFDKDNKLKCFEKANPRSDEARYTVYMND
jgi:hypothetical protein